MLNKDQDQEMKIMFDFIIRRFPCSENSFQAIKELVSANFNIPLDQINTKYKIFYLDSKFHEIPLSSENDIKLMLSILSDHKINKVKLQVKELNDLIIIPNSEQDLLTNFCDSANPKESESSYLSFKRVRGRPKKTDIHVSSHPNHNQNKKKRMIKEIQSYWNFKFPSPINKLSRRRIYKGRSLFERKNKRILKFREKNLKKNNFIENKLRTLAKSKKDLNFAINNDKENIKNSINVVPFKKFRYKNNVKSDDSKIEKWFLNARFLIRQYKKAEDKNSSYVITYEGKNKIKIQFRLRGSDKKFHCKGKLVHFDNDGYDEKWDSQTGIKKMELFLNYALENFEQLGKKVSLYEFQT